MNLFGFEITRSKRAGDLAEEKTKALLLAASKFQKIRQSWLTGSYQPYDPQTETYMKEGFLRNHHVSAVAGRILDKASAIPFFAYKVTSEKSLSDYRSLSGIDATPRSLMEARRVKRKALADLPENNPLSQRLKLPNPFQTWKDFQAEAIGYRMLSGERFLWTPGAPFLGAVPPESYILPPQLMEVVAGEVFRQIDRYVFTWDGMHKVPAEEIVFSRTFNPDYHTPYRGVSPFRAILRSIQASNEGMDAISRQFANFGPPAVVTGTDPNSPLGDTEVNTLKETFQSYTRGRKKGQIMVLSQPLEVLNLGLSPVDLAILESDMASLQAICNALSVDSLLFGKTDGRSGTAAELESARKRMVLDAVVPQLVSFRDDLNASWCKSGEYFLDFDYSKLPEMQEDELQKAQALQAQPYVTPREKRLHMGWDDDTRPEYGDFLDDYILDSSMVPYKQMQETAMLEDTPDDGSYQDPARP